MDEIGALRVIMLVWQGGLVRLFPAAVAASIVAVACAARVDAQSVDPGRQVFASRCAACHGTEGGGGELGPSIVARIPLRS